MLRLTRAIIRLRTSASRGKAARDIAKDKPALPATTWASLVLQHDREDEPDLHLKS